MTLVEDGFSSGQLIRPFPRLVQEAWRAAAHQRLDHALATAVPVTFDNASRFVFLSDCHRGDGTAVDRFARNKTIYLAALAHYFDSGHTYVEVGDGDELWQNGRFSDILTAHADVFERLHAYNDVGRLHLLVGNHDTYNHFTYQVDKDGIPTSHSLRLIHGDSGQEILVAHGHQADMTSSRYYSITRMLCRSVWRSAQSRGWVAGGASSAEMALEAENNSRTYSLGSQGKRIERRIIEWVQARGVPVICGHTHLPNLAAQAMPPYFNSGSCVTPGAITGLELNDGWLSLVKWSPDGTGQIRRQLLARPRPLFAAEWQRRSEAELT